MILAFIATLIELFVFIYLIYLYKKALKLMIVPETLQGLLKEYIEKRIYDENDNRMLIELIDIMGTERTTENARFIIRNYLSEYNDSIKTSTNLGPAIGLFFTFIGMLFTINDISKSPLDESYQLLQLNFQNLYPIFIGGASGILVYIIGSLLFILLSKKQNKLEDKLLITFINFEAENDPPRPRKIEDAYHKLVKPLIQLWERLNSLNIKFEELSNNIENLISVFNKSSKEYVDSIFEKTNELIKVYSDNSNKFINEINEKSHEFISKSEPLLSSLSKINQSLESLNNIFSETSVKWKESAEKLSNFSNNIKNIEEHLKSLMSISEDFSKLIKTLNSFNDKISELMEWVEKDRLDWIEFRARINEFVENMSNYSKNLEGYLLAISSKVNILDEIFSKIMELEKLLIPTFNENFDKVKNELVEIKNLLKNNKIPIDGNREIHPYKEQFNNIIELLNEIQSLIKNNQIETLLKNISKHLQEMKNGKNSFLSSLINIFKK